MRRYALTVLGALMAGGSFGWAVITWRQTRGVKAAIQPATDGTSQVTGSPALYSAASAPTGVWPPRSLMLIAFKQERRLEVWGDGLLLRSYPILAASGTAGPKRREGDRQVPEGIYRLTTLNPQSQFHLSIRVDYPDAEDRSTGCTGCDIYLHGGAVSIGCIAVGDTAIEEIYGLASRVANRWIMIVPWDLRRRPAPTAQEPWLAERYRKLDASLRALGR